jgi:trigger factor
MASPTDNETTGNAGDEQELEQEKTPETPEQDQQLEQEQQGDQPEEQEEEESLGTKSTLETLGPCKRRVKAEVPPDKVEEELDRNYRELISSVQIPGFRRGHVPRALLEKRYGEEIEGDVKEALLGLSFQEVVKENDLKVIGKPKFDNVTFTRGEALRYEVELEVRPEFQLASYVGVEVAEVGEDKVAPVTEATVDEQIERLRKKHPRLEPVDPKDAGPNDFFMGHYALRKEGMRLHLKEEARFQPESGNIDGIEVPDLKEKVASRADPSVIQAAVKVPDGYAAEMLRGKEVDLEFTIEETRKIEYPPVDDDLAKVYGVQSVAELRDRIRKELEAQRSIEIEGILEDRAMEKVEESVQFDLPEGLIEEQGRMRRMWTELSLIEAGMSREEIDAELKKLDETAGTDLRKEVKRYFILEKIAEDEKIFATEDDVAVRVALLARAYGRPAKGVFAEMEESGRIEVLRSEIRQSKTRDFLREKAKVVKPGEGQGPAAEGQGTGTAAPEAGQEASKG